LNTWRELVELYQLTQPALNRIHPVSTTRPFSKDLLTARTFDGV
jgi:hypothetical protein